MQVDVYACETSQCDPEVLVRDKDGVTYYGLRMKICNSNDQLTFWATSVLNLVVFIEVLRDRLKADQGQ
jgi:hypothetical protein